jgi:hypothetical protein
MDEATARAMLPQIDGLMLFDQSQKMRPEGFRESWTAGAHVIEQARKAQGGRRVGQPYSQGDSRLRR